MLVFKAISWRMHRDCHQRKVHFVQSNITFFSVTEFLDMFQYFDCNKCDADRVTMI